MSDVLTSLTLSKRKLMTCLSSAATVVVGTFSLPKAALAESMNKAEDINTEIDPKGVDPEGAEEVVRTYGDGLGVMICVPFSFAGPIKVYPISGAGKQIEINGPEPPEGRTVLARADLQIEVFDASPEHVRVCCPGGDTICVKV